MNLARPARSAFRTLVVLVGLVALSPAKALAEDDPFGGALFPPDLVLGHMNELDIDADQVAAIKAEIQEVQPLFLDRQLDLQAELGKLRKLVAAPVVDEGAALAQLDRILDLEREIKRAQVGLLIRIKNLLTPEQKRRLTELRAAR